MRQIVETMEAMEARLLERIELLTAKIKVVNQVKEKIGELDEKIEHQVARLDRVQTKVDLSMVSLGQVQQ